MATVNTFKAIIQLGVSRSKPAYKTPKKVLPASPINILEGCQLKIKNAVNAAISGKIAGVTIIANIERYKIIEPATKPSMPSMKFTKLIIAVKEIIRIKFRIKSNDMLFVLTFKEQKLVNKITMQT